MGILSDLLVFCEQKSEFPTLNFGCNSMPKQGHEETKLTNDLIMKIFKIFQAKEFYQVEPNSISRPVVRHLQLTHLI